VFHLRLEAGGQAGIPFADDWNAGAYVIRGAVQANGRPLREREMAVFERAGGDIEIVAGASSDLLVLAGQPIGEPVVSWGPFVMNTREEILAAQRDYALGRMGSLPERV
jgi:redox-sensitive bicupin YhaK (pirin superfamily)